MYPTIGHLISKLFGIEVNFPIPTYGFMLATAFVVGYIIIVRGFKRKEKEGILNFRLQKVTIGKPASIGELAISGIFGFVIGFKFLGIVFDYSSFSHDPAAFVLSTQGSFFSGIIIAAILIYLNYRSKKKEILDTPIEKEEKIYPHQLAGNILLWAAVSGVIGAKIFHQFEYPQDFLEDPLGSLFSAGGLTFYGGLIAGFIGVFIYCRKVGINLLQMMDVAAPAILLAYATGRIGCQLSGDGCWGVVNLAYASPGVTDGVYLLKPAWLSFLPDWMWAFDFPNNVISEGIPMHQCGGKYCCVLDEPVFPTSFYETIINTIFFGVLWSIRKYIKIPGTLFAIMIIMNGFERFFIEKIRVNSKMDFLGMQVTQAEIISTCLVLVGIGLIFFFKYWNKRVLRKQQTVG
ncbi:MAG: prolipoprotein diacylglyceryl transferase [Saprospiraceae bacterium]|nr:prolipoprotein diacylglyceryl transferase [Saprospiraceae bacterium]